MSDAGAWAQADEPAMRPDGRRRRPARGAVPLAWRNAWFDKHRLFHCAAGVGFAVLLMLVQLAFLQAFRDSSVRIINEMDGDIFLMSATKFRYSFKDPFSRRQLYAARAVAGVEWARPIYREWLKGHWKNPQTQKIYPVQVLAFDPDQPVFLIPGIQARLAELKQPDTALFDRDGYRFLGVAGEGTESELARRNIRIVGTFSLGPNFTFDGTLVTSDRTFLKLFAARNLAEGELADIEFGAVKVRPGFPVEDVRAALRQALPASVAVRTKAEFVALEIQYQDKESPVGPIFVLGTAIGFVVGMMISYQILFTEMSDLTPQFATLKAMGYESRYLVRVVLEQAALYAFIGFLPAWGVAAVLCRIIAAVTLVPLEISAHTLLIGAVLSFGMCMISGLIALRPVLAADPAEVF